MKRFFTTFSVILTLLALAFSALGVTSVHAAGIRYVKPVASGTGDCSSWANACTLQTALTSASSGDEIWVTAGTHKPTTGTDRTATFQLKNGVAVYGGFAGTEIARDGRDFVNNLTILSGDLKDDDLGFTNNSENVYHVVTGVTGATLDGFIITAGNANGSGRCPSTGCGGGVINNASSPILNNVIFTSNYATYGGGMGNMSSNPVLINVTFDRNSAENGGGMNNNSSNPMLNNVTFSGNLATWGAGIKNNLQSAPKITNTTFIENSASIGGAMINYNQSTPILVNVTISDNTAKQYGGGIYNSSKSDLQILNTIFWGNTASINGAQIYNQSGSVPTISDSVIQNGCPQESTCNNIITADPLLHTLGDFGGFTQTIPLLVGSSAIDAANDANCPAIDQRGITRPYGTHCDIGAYEYDNSTAVYYVKPIASGTGNCSSWMNACVLQTALTEATNLDEIWVAAGMHKPTTNPSDRAATFQLKDGISIYGGFSGTETMRSQRDFVTNVTILSGDIDNDDSQTPIITDIKTVTGNTTNSYHVVVGATDAVLDGFTISGGNANDDSIFVNNRGGGMFNNSSSPALTNIAFIGNSANYGGGMFNSSSSPVLTNVTFSGNSALGSGGGMDNESGSDPRLVNITFSSNTANYGGGVFNEASSPILINITFSSNSAYWGGGMDNSASKPVLTNVTFSGNSANNGGGLSEWNSSDLQIHNAIFWGNTALTGAQIYHNDDTSTSDISNSIVQSGCPVGSTCTSILTADPMLSTLGNYGGFTQTIPILAGSAAIDAGDDSSCAATDQRGVTRPQGAHCDIGAYETLDAIAPDTQIDSYPFGPTTNSNASFIFSSGESTATFECSLDGAVFTSCNSPKNYTALTNGLHMFSVRAKDQVGNVDITPTSYTWLVDTNHVAGTLFAKMSVSGVGDCSSWVNACLLQTALATAFNGDEIWVAAGTYKPTVGTNRAVSFQLKSDVAVYGGFVGTETALDQRNPVANVTILSGDIDNNDSQRPIITDILTVTGNTTNSYHIVTGATGAILDGFTITAGNANESDCFSCGGGGIYNNNSSPMLKNIIFSGNTTKYYGGGIYNYKSSNPLLQNVIFSSNSAYCGGGISNDSSNPTLMNVTFTGNSVTEFGGGIHNWNSDPSLTNVNFSSNSASNGGGMMNYQSGSALMNVSFSSNTAGNGGGMSNYKSSPTLVNVTFDGNSATGNYGNGGGMLNYVDSSPTLTNVTFESNSARDYGGGMENDSRSNPQIFNTIVWGNTAAFGAQIYNQYSSNPVIRDTVVQNGCPVESVCKIIIINDPMLGAFGDYGGFTQTIPLLPGSSAIDATSTNCPAIDQRGVARGTTCDLGAFESKGFTLTKTGGDNQSAFVNTAFTNPLGLTVTANNAVEPVNGGLVTFIAPSSSASTNPATNTASIAGGVVSQSVTANGIAGGPYNIVVSATGATSVNFALTNIAVPITISGSTGIAGATLSYTDGTPKTVTADGSGNYSITVPHNWTGAVKPSKTGYVFTPASKTYTNLAANQTNQNYIASSGAAIDVYIGTSASPVGSYQLKTSESARVNYAGVNNGPLKITSTNGVPIIAALRDAWQANGVWTSFAQLMGLPASQVSDTYYFPAYNNISLDEQLRFGNVGTADTTVTVTIGGQVKGSYFLHPGESARVNYAEVNSGPVIVKSSGGVNIIAAERDAWQWNGVWYSFVQLMGLPASQLSDTYYFPAYNNISLDEQLRFGNVGTADTTVTVTIGGQVKGSYFLHPNESARVNYAGVNSGPVVVQSSDGVPIIVAERDAWQTNGVWTSFAQTMGLPVSQVSDTYVFPAYNNISLDEQLRFGNVGTADTTVTVTIGGQPMGSYFLHPSESARVNYAGVNSGPVVVKSSGNVSIIAAERDAWRWNGVWYSFVQTMGLPAGQLSDTYVFPAYNNISLDEQLRFGVP